MNAGKLAVKKKIPYNVDLCVLIRIEILKMSKVVNEVEVKKYPTIKTYKFNRRDVVCV